MVYTDCPSLADGQSVILSGQKEPKRAVPLVHPRHQAISAPGRSEDRKDRGPTSTKATRNPAQGKPTPENWSHPSPHHRWKDWDSRSQWNKEDKGAMTGLEGDQDVRMLVATQHALQPPLGILRGKPSITF